MRPTSPNRSISARSMCVCMSSSWMENSNLPPSISSAISSRAATMRRAASSVSNLTSASIRAWALLAMMSWRYRRRSKLIDSVNASTRSSVAEVNRPPQVFWLTARLAEERCPVTISFTIAEGEGEYNAFAACGLAFTCGSRTLSRKRQALSRKRHSESQFLELFRIDRRRRARHQVAGALILRERDHVADVGGAGQHHGPAVQSQRDAAVWRRAEFQRIEQEAEALLRLVWRHSQHG